jgi:hypothetical protein
MYTTIIFMQQINPKYDTDLHTSNQNVRLGVIKLYTK